ncbi:MAG TPA: hypothetical protein VHT02_08705 [Methylocella sp.]|nr:hypothetical protein [Methylocella sp.]
MTLPKTAATGKTSANMIAGSSAAIFPIDAGHGLDLAFEASDFPHKFILGQLLNVM